MTTDHVAALEQLVAIKALGLITDAAYESKRAEIIARLTPPDATPRA